MITPFIISIFFNVFPHYKIKPETLSFHLFLKNKQVKLFLTLLSCSLLLMKARTERMSKQGKKREITQEEIKFLSQHHVSLFIQLQASNCHLYSSPIPSKLYICPHSPLINSLFVYLFSHPLISTLLGILLPGFFSFRQPLSLNHKCTIHLCMQLFPIFICYCFLDSAKNCIVVMF